MLRGDRPAGIDGTPHFILLGIGHDSLQEFGTANCGRTPPMSAAPGDNLQLIVGGTVSGFQISVLLGQDTPSQELAVPLSAHATLELQEPDTTDERLVPAPAPRLASTQTWHVETTGPPRFVVGLAYTSDQSFNFIGAHAELKSQAFRVTGITPTPDGGQGNLTPRAGHGGHTASYAWAYGFSAGDEPVVADLVRETAAGVVWASRDEGLIVREFPLAPTLV